MKVKAHEWDQRPRKGDPGERPRPWSHVRAREEGSLLWTRKWALGGHSIRWGPHLGLGASRSGSNKCVSKPASR